MHKIPEYNTIQYNTTQYTIQPNTTNPPFTTCHLLPLVNYLQGISAPRHPEFDSIAHMPHLP